MPHYYVETDGEVYLIQENGQWRFPARKESLPFPVEALRTMFVLGEEVHFCKPLIAYHPHWCHKDEVVSWDNVHPLVTQAINTSLPRVVAEAVVVECEKILLVKPNRGFNEGRWTLPGGYVGYGESTQQAVVREVSEELGVRCEAGKLLDLESFVGQDSCFHWHMCFYEVKLLDHDFVLPQDEIEEIRWFPLDEAIKAVSFENIQSVLKKLYDKRAH